MPGFAYQAIAEVTNGPAHRLCHAGNRVDDDFPREYQERMYQPSTYTNISSDAEAPEKFRRLFDVGR